MMMTNRQLNWNLGLLLALAVWLVASDLANAGGQLPPSQQPTTGETTQQTASGETLVGANDTFGDLADPAPLIQEEEEEEEEEERERIREEEEKISLDEVLEFSRKYLPDVAEHFRHLLKEEKENDEVVEYVLDRGREMIHGFHEISEAHGRRMGERFLHLFQLNLEIEQLQHQLAEGNGEDRERALTELKMVVAKKYAIQLQLEKAELNQLRAEVEEFEEEIRRREENRNEIIRDEIRQLIEEASGQHEDQNLNEDEDEERDREEIEEEEEEDDEKEEEVESENDRID